MYGLTFSNTTQSKNIYFFWYILWQQRFLMMLTLAGDQSINNLIKCICWPF